MESKKKVKGGGRQKMVKCFDWAAGSGASAGLLCANRMLFSVSVESNDLGQFNHMVELKLPFLF